MRAMTVLNTRVRSTERVVTERDRRTDARKSSDSRIAR
jgi:hypothetical protein